MATLEKLAKQYTKLAVAGVSFKQVRVLADWMQTEAIPETDLRFCGMMAGVVVTYAMNFVEGEGIGPLDIDKFAEFKAEPNHERTHARLMEARHTLYAHRDATAAATYTYDNAPRADPYHARVRLSKTPPHITVLPSIPEVPSNLLRFISGLCEFQIKRVDAEMSRVGDILWKGKTYREGTYTVGLDFP